MPPKVHNFFRKGSFAGIGKRRQPSTQEPKKESWGPSHSFDSEDSTALFNLDDHVDLRSNKSNHEVSSPARGKIKLKSRSSSSPQMVQSNAQPNLQSDSYDHSGRLTAQTTPSSMQTKTSAVPPQEPGSNDTTSTKSSHSSAGSRRQRTIQVLESKKELDFDRVKDEDNGNGNGNGNGNDGDIGNDSDCDDEDPCNNDGTDKRPASALSGSFSKSHPLQAIWLGARSAFNCKDDTTDGSQRTFKISNTKFMDYVQDACSPCHPRTLDETLSNEMMPNEEEMSQLGIARMEPPDSDHMEEKKEEHVSVETQRSAGTRLSDRNVKQAASSDTVSTPVERRRERHRRNQMRMLPRTKEQSDKELQAAKDDVEVTTTQVICKEVTSSNSASSSSSKKKKPMPLNTLTVKTDEAKALERSISELTMRSSYGEATAKLAENRRMAYYAVGRHHRNSGRGGNRRCYFTGKLILGGAPFYAGSVQQGLRTLVVFCLPSAVGLPEGVDMKRDGSFYSLTPSSAHSSAAESLSIQRRLPRSDGSFATHSVGVNVSQQRSSILSHKRSNASRLSSVDDMSMSIEEEMDPNWGLDRDYLLSVLPEPTEDLLDEMATRYPAQFETLPVQVRSPHCWRLYVKFCFFSGLPIAEGEMHYKVADEICESYGEEIILSHEVMEAVNGDSAEILRLPNLKTFRYLRRHYSQQSGKLPEDVFLRQSWELVRPEV